MTQDRVSLAVTFAGLKLKSPIIAASAPPTESVAALCACARAGAGAVVTKSIVDYDRNAWPNIPRRVKRDRQRFWIQGSFSSETLTVPEGVAMISEARNQIDIPIIASVGVLDPSGDAAIDTATRLVEAGADFVHFDLFYLPQPRCTDAIVAELRALFARARKEIPAPFGPKLNADIPAHLFASAVSPGEVDAVFLLDSIRVPPPLSATGEPQIGALRGGLECSLFGGDWQKPITLQYSRVLAEASMPNLSVGGGLRGAEDILEAIMLGATTVQAATPIILHGFDWITRTNDHLEQLLEQRRHGNLSDARGLALRVRDRNAPEHVLPIRAVVDADRCVPCGVCTKLAFCEFITAEPGGVPQISADCYGCGLCVELCPPKAEAIRMEAAE
ncbi:MAG: hypothetical protein WBO29_05310 [Albidovulum sp.]